MDSQYLMPDIFLGGDRKKHLELTCLGYTKLERLDHGILKKLKSLSTDLIRAGKAIVRDGELTNLINADIETKLASNGLVAEFLNPHLASFIDTNKSDVLPVGHVIKPFGYRGQVWHQDAAIVDESVHFSLNAWMPLVDSNRWNGYIWILPGSHINKNLRRQFGYDPFSPSFWKIVQKHMVPISMKAGEILLFHRSMLHGSSTNWLPYDRVAVESVIVNKAAQLYNFHRDETLAKDKVFGFKVDMEHYLRVRPKDDFFTGRYPYILFDDVSKTQITQELLDGLDTYRKMADKVHDEAA